MSDLTTHSITRLLTRILSECWVAKLQIGVKKELTASSSQSAVQFEWTKSNTVSS